jgi:hypothetical protein
LFSFCPRAQNCDSQQGGKLEQKINRKKKKKKAWEKSD